jgi:hypothetical protein
MRDTTFRTFQIKNNEEPKQLSERNTPPSSGMPE